MAIGDAFDYRTYILRSHFLRYNGKLLARKDRFLKRTETIIKTYQFDKVNSDMVLSFPKPFKRAHDFMGVQKSVSVWLLPFFIAKFPEVSITI